MDIPSLSEIECEIIADIQAVSRRCRWPASVRPTLKAYRDAGGHFDANRISSTVGWKRLCALAGMTPALVIRKPRVSRPLVTFAPPPDFDTIVADVRRVAKLLRLKPGDGLTLAAYLHSGGLYSQSKLVAVGGWKKLSAGAGVPSQAGKQSRAVHREVPVLARGEIIADIREVSLSVGLLSPRLLTFAIYRQHGGRYTHEQTSTLGGFDTLRRAA